ncbi:MAG: transporter substrate-binding domain-containing protein [Parachlamydiaceae bacterium]
MKITRLNLLILFFATLCFGFSASALAAEVGAKYKKCNSIADIKERGKLLVGIYNDDPYFSFINPLTYQLEGFDVDVARAIAQEIMGNANKIEFVIVDSTDRLNALELGQVDLVIAELSMTEKRRATVDFSDVYYVAGQSVLVNADSSYQSLKDLKGKPVGALAGSTNAEHLRKALPDSTFVYFQTLSSGFQALRQQQIQAFCIDDVLLLALRDDSKRVLKDYRFIGGEILWESYGIAARKGCVELVDAVNQALKKIKSDGRWQQIYDANIGKISHVSASPPM